MDMGNTNWSDRLDDEKNAMGTVLKSLPEEVMASTNYATAPHKVGYNTFIIDIKTTVSACPLFLTKLHHRVGQSPGGCCCPNGIRLSRDSPMLSNADA